MSTSIPYHYLRVSISRQCLEVFPGRNSNEKKEPLAIYKISSSRFGLGTEAGSLCTPLGSFVIEEKIGDHAPERMIFEARKPIGIIANLEGEEDYVLTRILWLSGLEPENANTRDRYIYIHGTNQENLLGSPASHGCIRLANTAMVELFNIVQEGDLVEIIAS
ncbi:MAG: L,D-transpeptidase [Verrucomicrobia bacterium]|nr:MAG: L,D-transpeptidase [Verrucomicrobiota bacterium]